MTSPIETRDSDGPTLDAMTPHELAALLSFHADCGVEWLLEDDPIDRIAAFAESQATRDRAGSSVGGEALRNSQGSRGAAPKNEATSRAPSSAPQTRQTGGSSEAAPRPVSTRVAIPDEQAVAEARIAAGSAQTLADLKLALDGFTGCNLRNSARNLVFAEGDPASGLMIVGPGPNGDDDREGRPFAGRQGDLLDKMLAAIGLDRSGVLITNVIPWRPPGNRMPSARELEICRPFLDRQFALAKPRRVLVLGNFAARFFFGGSDTIHEMRGDWRTITTGGETFRALATLHPQDLMSAPICKRLAWQDLQMFTAPDAD
ncbi:DNA polymerase [Rhizobium sp. Leaf384]|uniref:uracil-DNA glycosylase n=1 Tax=unclassified Rhizobium TaxID=2613769 RepID=UPI0007127560|nr:MULTISPECIES: uracil-DNA glycosylase [unclassified Rhizobium]KQS77483.1 DNA polymerase [Rhizobium sp. Leaf383]KQS80611.1 DNA polymerase [Rhizobium sp. Leaf384]